MTTQNWPDPKRPGVLMFPDYYGEHILKELVTGKEVPACWDANCPRNPGWDISALNSQTPETVALYFTYVRCEAIKLTPHADKRNAGGGTGAVCRRMPSNVI